MSIELQLTTGDEEWTFNMTESIVPSYVRDFRVAGRRITLLQGERVGSVAVPAMTTCTWRSTITPVTRSSRSTPTNEAIPARASCCEPPRT